MDEEHIRVIGFHDRIHGPGSRKRGQIPGPQRPDVRLEEMRVFIPCLILEIEDMPAVRLPVAIVDSALGGIGNGPVVVFPYRFHPDVLDSVERSAVSNLLSVR